MGWAIFIGYIVYGVFMNLIMMSKDDLEAALEKAKANNADEERIKELRREVKNITVIFNVMIFIAIGSLVIFILYCFGWVWYYFCCGFLVFEDCSFGDKIVYGLMSLIPLGFFIGFIAICFGWDPSKKR